MVSTGRAERVRRGATKGLTLAMPLMNVSRGSRLRFSFLPAAATSRNGPWHLDGKQKRFR